MGIRSPPDSSNPTKPYKARVHKIHVAKTANLFFSKPTAFAPE